MTQDEIIEMAEKCGWNQGKSWDDCMACSPFNIEAFAKLVEEKEREACAEVCDEIYIHSIEDWEGANWCGDAIRARGQA